MTPTAAPAEAPGEAFEAARQSLGLVREGIVTDEELKQPTMICVFGYFSIFDYYWRFRQLQIAFFDLRKGDELMKVGQFVDDLSSENGELDRLFGEISARFFPGKPNPFKDKKEQEQ